MMQNLLFNIPSSLPAFYRQYLIDADQALLRPNQKANSLARNESKSDLPPAINDEIPRMFG